MVELMCYWMLLHFARKAWLKRKGIAEISVEEYEAIRGERIEPSFDIEEIR